VCRLSGAQLARLRAALEGGPAAWGSGENQRWTLARVTELIGRRFHARCTLRGTSYLLRRIEFTPQVPVHRAAGRDEKAIMACRTGTSAKVRSGGHRRVDRLRGRGRPGPAATGSPPPGRAAATLTSSRCPGRAPDGYPQRAGSASSPACAAGFFYQVRVHRGRKSGLAYLTIVRTTHFRIEVLQKHEQINCSQRVY
jgi:hypothetical protein